ncbi:acyl-CoA dehydrogenase family protein [Sphingomonas morindae]|uniref:Acyl-CoA/acyl-ACP dehydrogenase n=1 Tax=Sphingomonas morindae TaxID=1541170 RepID=A0ABY4XD55_9SPHN|nr:acyl-CoA dehydrogenase family protein [Sphingomonas morindae]USI74897.1 acyl-CoA/acyl-ACP dehydrogenase [Sphingomonas morindae]
MLIPRVRALAARWDAGNDDESFPTERLRALEAAGAWDAFRVLDDAEATRQLCAVLRLIGGADLSLGRVFEGHVNAIQLIEAYGDARQRARLTQDLAQGAGFGIWNTEPAPGVTITPAPGGWRLAGAKSFATGAGHLDRALITARRPDGGRQLVLVDIGGAAARADSSGWRVRGMRGTQSGLFDFSGMVLDDTALIGAPGDYEREPRFSAGAWRFTAVQLGAVEALLRHWRDHLRASGKAEDPLHRRRFAAAVVATRSAGLWVAQAAMLAEAARPEAIAHVLMTRGLVEEAALQTMEGAARGVGTAAFFESSRIDRITRDLGLYLRQPVPDQARDRAAIAWLEADNWGEDGWW